MEKVTEHMSTTLWSRVGREQSLPYVTLALGLILIGLSASHASSEYISAGISAVCAVCAPFVERAVVREIGIALAIVGLATVSVEKRRIAVFTQELSEMVDHKLTQIEDTTRDAIFRGPLPRRYYETVREFLLLNRFQKSEWNVKIVLRPVPTNHDYYVLDFDQTYRVTNLHGSDRSYPLIHYEALTPVSLEDIFPSNTRILYVRARVDNASTFLINEVAADGATVGARKEDKVIFEKPIPLKTGESVLVEEASVIIVRSRDGNELVIWEPTMGLRVVVEHPPELLVSIGFPDAITNAAAVEAGKSSVEVNDRVKRSMWEYGMPLLPGTIIALEWRAVDARTAVES
jgi:hypothetical protein